jgi:hypothetical protein
VRRVNNPLTGLSRWKIFDNLRRSLVPLSLLLLLPIGWLIFPGHALGWSFAFIGLIGLPSFLTVIAELGSKPREVPEKLHLIRTARLAGRHAGQALLTIAFLPYDACLCLDAIVRTIGRLVITRRNLLQWQTASEVEESESGTLGRFFATMWCGPVLALAFLAVPIIYAGSMWAAALPFLLTWFISPVAAWWISLPLEERRSTLAPEEVRELRTVARKTWKFFEKFVGPEDHWLPPDNFQENPRPVLATRTSPTNIGMALLSTLGAYDFGYLSRAFLQLVRHAHAQAAWTALCFYSGQREPRQPVVDASLGVGGTGHTGMEPSAARCRFARHASCAPRTNSRSCGIADFGQSGEATR